MSLSSVAILAGAAIAVQAAMNARLGVILLSPLAAVMTYSLCGQLFVAALFSHHGWLGLPQRALDGPRLLGLVLLVVGVVLFNRGGGHAAA